MMVRTGLAHKKILFVDDQHLIRLSIARLLKKYSFEVTCTSSAEYAIAHLNSHHFDLCIFDIVLPDIDGLSMMKIVKEMSPDTPVIIVTGGSVDDSMQATIDLHATYLITKPFEVRHFVDCVIGSLHKPNHCLEHLADSCFTQGNNKRDSVRKFHSQSIKLTYNQYFTNDADGVRKISRKDLLADIIDINEGGLGIQTNFPLIKNHVVEFKEFWEGKLGVVKWSTQQNEEAYNCGVKFM